MVQTGVSGQISGSSDEAILQTVLEKSATPIHTGSLLLLLFLYKPHTQIRDILCFKV